MLISRASCLLLVFACSAVRLPAALSPITIAFASPTPRHARAPPPLLLGTRARTAPGVVPLGGLLQAEHASILSKRTARRRRGESKERARSGADERREAAVRDGVLPFEWLLVLDVEATCDVRGRDWEHEIIEFPVVALNLRTLQVFAHAWSAGVGGLSQAAPESSNMSRRPSDPLDAFRNFSAPALWPQFG
jgi:hypothetical protein